MSLLFLFFLVLIILVTTYLIEQHFLSPRKVLDKLDHYDSNARQWASFESSATEDELICFLCSLENGSTLQNALFELSGQKTVPNIFINGKHLGEYEDEQSALSFSPRYIDYKGFICDPLSPNQS